MTSKKVGTILALFVATCMPAWSAKKMLEGIPLVWKPTDQEATGVVNLTGIAEVKLRVETFRDTRSEPGKIGENTEDSVAKPVTTNDDVAVFITKNFTDTLRSYGFTLVEGAGDVVLRCDVLEFMVREGDNYKGELRLKATVERSGKPVWTGLVSGSAKRFGRSYKAENYYETMSDAIIRAASNLAKDSGFHGAIAAR
jgi:hypothetical protein